MPIWVVFAVVVYLVLCYPVSTGTNKAAEFATLSLFVGIPVVYLMPWINAYMRGHRNTTSILAVNVFLGWTLVGWVLALAWSYKVPEAEPTATPLPQGAAVEPSAAAAAGGTNDETRQCPYCAELVKAAAVKCKHCGSALSASPAA